MSKLRVRERGAGNREQLALPLAEARTALAQHRVVALGQVLDEVVGTCQLGRGDDFGVAGLGASVADVVHHRVAKEETVLQHHADLPAQRVELNVAHVDAVDRHLAAGHVVEAGQQVDQRRLARARWPDDGDGLARCGHQVDALEHRFARLVFGHHLLEDHPPDDGRHRLCVEFLDDLRLLVEQVEDALGAGNRALDVGPEHGNLGDGLVETLHVADEGDDQPQRHGEPPSVIPCSMKMPPMPATSATAT